MEIEYGSEVIDKNGNVLGRVDHLVRNTWTGEISKFMVRRRAPDRDLFFSTQDVLEIEDGGLKAKLKIKLSISLDKLGETR